jgi:hypothetical protein
MKCPRCKRTWRTLEGEEQDHDCPHCGPLPTPRNEDDEPEPLEPPGPPNDPDAEF